ncbi:MAG TPA: tripartite tricarboxylate transporter substrate binding protein [Reyranella sp.]|nr:tripartite tricarboxylate transporter substrate binding protein [Reyranella sp.]
MKLPRRRILHVAAGAATLPVLLHGAQAQTYPSRPVRWVVGFAPAGGNDIVARLMGQWLSERTGQQFIVENRPGAATNIATEIVVNAPSDGYTLLFVGVSAAINATLYDNLSFNFQRDIAPAAGIMSIPLFLVTSLSVPARTLPEFVAYAKANPGKVNMGSAGIGSAGHLAGELFNMAAGVNLVHVPYRGNGPALAALLGGEIEVLFPTPPSSIEYIRTGKLRGLATTGAMRSEALPDLPTAGEFVAGYETSAWYGVGVPKGTPVEVIDKIHKEVSAGLADPRMKARFADLGGAPMPMTAAEFAKLIADETEKWAKVIRRANLKPV